LQDHVTWQPLAHYPGNIPFDKGDARQPGKEAKIGDKVLLKLIDRFDGDFLSVLPFWRID